MAEKITLGEIKEIIVEEKILPSDLFGMESLTKDPLVRGYLDSSFKELKGKLSGEYDARKRVEKDKSKEQEELEEEKKKLEDENKVLKAESAKIKAADLFSTKAKERKLDKKEIAFIETKRKAARGGFEPEDPEKLTEEVDKFMDDAITEYKETAKIFGVKTEKKKEGSEEEEKEDEPSGGSEPVEGELEDGNELIPD